MIGEESGGSRKGHRMAGRLLIGGNQLKREVQSSQSFTISPCVAMLPIRPVENGRRRLCQIARGRLRQVRAA
jgi:hypothetical protein